MSEYYKTLNLEGHGPRNKKEFIDLNKIVTSLKKGRTASNRIKRCAICKKTGVKYCNSHTIPQFILKNIDKNGKLLNTQVFNSTKFIDEEKGINKTQVFHSICTNCDNIIFKDYERMDSYKIEPSQIILKQIALKNHLYSSYKHNQEKTFYNNIVKKLFNSVSSITNNHPLKYMLKVTEHNYCYNNKRANLIIKNLSKDIEMYKLCYFKRLNYTVPIALQDNSIISFGFNNERLANIFDFPSFDYADDIHFCIYPMENESIIMLFCAKNLNIYVNFFEILKKQEEREQLSIINFLVFAYFEEVFLNKDIDKSIFNNANLKTISQEQMITTTNSCRTSYLTETERDNFRWNALAKNFNISNHNKIPNLLDISHRIS